METEGLEIVKPLCMQFQPPWEHPLIAVVISSTGELETISENNLEGGGGVGITLEGLYGGLNLIPDILPWEN